MAEAKYEWQTIHKSKADALKALEEHREGIENGLRMPDVPGDEDTQVQNLIDQTEARNDLKENLRAKMHVADPNTPEGPIDLNPQVDGLYPGERSNPLDPVGELTSQMKQMPAPSAVAAEARSTLTDSRKTEDQQKLANAIYNIGAQIALYKIELEKGEAPVDRMLKSKRITFQKLFMFFDKSVKPCNYGTSWYSIKPKPMVKLFCNVAQALNRIVLDLAGHQKSSPENKIRISLFLKLATPFTKMHKKMVDSGSRDDVDVLMEMTEDEIRLEQMEFERSFPVVPKGGKRKTRKYKKRRGKKSKTRKGKKSRKHKSKTHKKRKHRRGRKSRKH